MVRARRDRRPSRAQRSRDGVRREARDRSCCSAASTARCCPTPGSGTAARGRTCRHRGALLRERVTRWRTTRRARWSCCTAAKTPSSTSTPTLGNGTARNGCAGRSEAVSYASRKAPWSTTRHASASSCTAAPCSRPWRPSRVTPGSGDGHSWTQRSSGSAVPRRGRHAMAYDAARRRIVRFGGVEGAFIYNDHWEFAPVFPADYASFGAGCAGSAGTPSLSAESGPAAVDRRGVRSRRDRRAAGAAGHPAPRRLEDTMGIGQSALLARVAGHDGGASCWSAPMSAFR